MQVDSRIRLGLGGEQLCIYNFISNIAAESEVLKTDYRGLLSKFFLRKVPKAKKGRRLESLFGTYDLAFTVMLVSMLFQKRMRQGVVIAVPGNG